MIVSGHNNSFKLIVLLCLIFIDTRAAAVNIHFVGTAEPIPLAIQHQMQGVSWHVHCPVSLKQLSYLQLSYWGFDNKIHQGVLIVNHQVVNQVISIFHQLFLQHFSIYQMRPVYQFDGNDLKSMQANNTSAFDCRLMIGSHDKISAHSYGTAIDINPIQNPYAHGIRILPASAKKYVNRNQDVPGMIKVSGVVYKIFHQYGWEWGGKWRYSKDYQHFQKNDEKGIHD